MLVLCVCMFVGAWLLQHCYYVIKTAHSYWRTGTANHICVNVYVSREFT